MISEGPLQKTLPIWVATVISFSFAGCARLQFNAGEDPAALTFYEAEPYLFVQTNKDCVSTATTITLPGKNDRWNSDPAMVRLTCL